MLKNFKGLSMILFLALVFSLVLVGCSSDKGSNSGSDLDNGKDEETYDITMAYMQTSDLSDIKTVEEEISKLTKEKINATVTLLPIQAGAWQQQTNLMLTSNEKLDLLMTSSFYNYSSQVSKGQLIPLDDLLQSHGQGILEVVPEHILNGSSIDGEVFGISSFREWSANYGFIMRKDLVDKHNIDISQVNSIEDFGHVFKVIKENEPEIDPIAIPTNPVEVIMHPNFDRLGGAVGSLDITKDDWTVINEYEHQLYKDGIDLTREWNEAGYIMKDAGTSDEAVVNIMKAGNSFGYFNSMKPGFEQQESDLTGYELVAERLTEVHQFTDVITAFMMSIAKNSENPEKAMEFMNLLYTDAEIMNLLTLGVEGKHYELNEEGFVTLPEGVTETGYTFNQWMIGNNFLTHIWEGQDADYWDQILAFNESATISPAFGFTFDPDPVKTEIAAISNVLEQYTQGLGSGVLDPEKTYPEFIDKLKAAGADKIIEEKQKQLDEWRAIH